MAIFTLLDGLLITVLHSLTQLYLALHQQGKNGLIRLHKVVIKT
jgi:hypothetical protein